MRRLSISILGSCLICSHAIAKDIVVLTSGETLQVQIDNIDDVSIYVTHEILGEMQIQLAHIDYYNQDSSSSTTDVIPEPPPNQEELPLETKSPWKHHLQLGLGYLRSQHDNFDLNTSYKAEKQTEKEQVLFNIGYRFAESNQTRTTNWLSSSLSNTWFIPQSPWDFFTTIQVDWSEFQSWDQRIVGDFGVALRIIERETPEDGLLLKARLGSGFRKEFNSHQEDVIPEGLLGLSLDWKIGPTQTIQANSTWFPDFNDSKHYRIVTNATWRIKLDSLENLSFVIGLHHEYDSNVDIGVENAFLQVTAGINYTF